MLAPFPLQERGVQAIHDGVAVLCADVTDSEAWQGVSVTPRPGVIKY